MNSYYLRFAIIFLVLVFSIDNPIKGQGDVDALFIKKIHDRVLQYGACYQWLNHLSEEIGGRLAGSENADIAVEYTKEILGKYADTVYLQPCKVPYWTRGKREVVKITDTSQGRDFDLGGLALGNSIGTGAQGIKAQVIEVQSLDEVRELGADKVAGKIVFFNRPMDPTQINTFYAYGGAVDQRVNGPAVAAEYGAVGAVVRSMTTALDDLPHTGVTRYADGGAKIPAVAISTRDADILHTFIKKQPVSVYIETHCKMHEEKTGYNVVAEIKGSTNPEEIILVGGHLDSWDIGGGAHDDGAGCVHSMQVFQTLKSLNYRPKRTLRCVLFMNEENGLGGGLAYAAQSDSLREFHMAAIESDAGGFTPRGFSCDAEDDIYAGLFKRLSSWDNILSPYHLTFMKGGSGADISPLKSQRGLLMGFRPDSQRYFDFHHAKNDRIKAVNERELKLGAAAITSLVYLLDKHGLNMAEDEE